MFSLLKDLFGTASTEITNPPQPAIPEDMKAIDLATAQIEAIKRYRQEMFNACHVEIEAGKASVDEFKARISAAEKFMDESGLAQGVSRMMTQVWLWKRAGENSSKGFPVPADYDVMLTGGGQLPHNGCWITFNYGSNHYKVELKPEDTDNFSMDVPDYFYAKTVFTCGTKKVLAADLEQRIGAEYFVWNYNSVSKLDKSGTWIPEMVELFTKMEIESRRQSADFQIASIKNQAEGLPRA